ncbi:MAG: methyltransferase domain-containing protein [Actinomycetota bacterium]
MTRAERVRRSSYGQQRAPTLADRFGVWLSTRRMRRAVPDFTGKRVGDFGCGYNATFARALLDRAPQVVLIDVALAGDLKDHSKVKAIEGTLPQALEELEAESLDVIVLNSVLEHLWEPEWALAESWRLARPGGVVLVNVPSWRGKRWLELSAFRLGTSPAEEMDDHKAYYDPRDLWPLLVRAGFKPSDIRCFRHKFGLNTFAECRRAGAPGKGS